MSDEQVYEHDGLDVAARDTVRGYVDPVTGRKGAEALAKALDWPYSTVQNKANPTQDFTRFNLKEARAVMLRTGDKRMLYQLAADVGEACVPLPTFEYAADADLLAAWADWSAEVGETAVAAKEVLADGRVTLAEVDEVRRELIEDFERGLAMLDVFKGMAEPDDRVVHFRR